MLLRTPRSRNAESNFDIVTPKFAPKSSKSDKKHLAFLDNYVYCRYFSRNLVFVLLSFCPFLGGSVSQLAAVGLSLLHIICTWLTAKKLPVLKKGAVFKTRL